MPRSSKWIPLGGPRHRLQMTIVVQCSLQPNFIFVLNIADYWPSPEPLEHFEATEKRQVYAKWWW
jgi:hypothetical protein